MKTIAVISNLNYDFNAMASPAMTTGKVMSLMLDGVLNRVKTMKPDLLLVPGDLTLNGDQASHLALQGKFQNLVANGTKVYVIPGNQDVLPGPPNFSANDFVQLYYNNLLNNNILFEKDPASLTYLAQPFQDLYILGMACEYRNYQGFIPDSARKWIKKLNIPANNHLMLGLIHPSVTEDFTDESVYGKFYIVKDHSDVEADLRGIGLKIILHGHVHDITTDQNSFFDIGTGALFSLPARIRKIEINDDINITTEIVRVADLKIDNPQYWEDKVNKEAWNVFFGNFQNLFRGEPFYIDPADPKLDDYASAGADALTSHYRGDEKSQNTPPMPGWDPRVADAMTKVYIDLAPGDQKFTIKHAQLVP